MNLGSTFKMVTAVAGLETGKITATEKINDTGIYPAGTNPHCWYYDSYKVGHGPLNVVGALAKSCNYFFYETGTRVGIDELARYAKYFGLGVKTGIELNSESSGLVATPSTQDYWGVGDTLSASIGQGNNIFTPLQMCKYIAMIANGGKNIDVSIVKNIINSDGTTEQESVVDEFVKNELGLTTTSSDDTDVTVSEESLAVVREGMKSVAEEGGTASTVFRDFGIELGGKTGSAEAGKDSDGNDVVNAWFVGFAPYDNPQIAVVVMIANGGHGVYTANVVKTIIQEYFGMDTKAITENMSVESELESFN
jgi:penicillin-binding protein 2